MDRVGEENVMKLIHPIALTLFIMLPVLVAVLLIGRRANPGIRRILPLVFRSLTIVALVLVVAGLQNTDTSLGLDAVFVVDVSDSIGPEGWADAERFVADALSSQDDRDRAAVVLVGSNVAVERGLQPGLRSLTTESILDRAGTSLADGILRALSLFTDQRKRRIIVLTDGQETTGDAADAARIAHEAGVELSVVPLSTRPSQGEVFVRRIEAPTEVRVDESHEFSVVIAATEPTDALVTVFRDGEYYGEDEVLLGPGDNAISFQGTIGAEGVHRYSALVTSLMDSIAVNNEAETLIRVSGEPSILYVANDPTEPALRALASQGINTVVTSVESMPSDVNELVIYDSVVFDNVPAYDMSVPRMEAVERYVRDTGGGFIMLGGDASFGAGGYYQTPIERTLPVDMDVTSSMKIPSLAMVFVIDKSGSMGAVESGGSTKLDLVKEAVISSIEIMNPFYSVGLLAFDADWEWTVPMIQAGQRAAIIADLAGLESGGGTVLDNALLEAHETLANVDAAVRHLIVLSDGLTSDADFETIIGDLTRDAITVSTVSVGSSANRELMAQMAEWGNGRSYHAADTNSVPRIFAAETTIVSRNLIVEETFVPIVLSTSPILEGINTSEIPPLEGFVLSYQKTGAQMVLAGTARNPVLSTWQYGLGRSVAFTSDFRAKWGINWLDWPQYSQILAQMVRWSQRPVGSSRFQVRFQQETDHTNLVVDAVEADGHYRNLLDLYALVQPPSGETTEIPLEQVAPGRYEVQFDSREEGNYLVTVYGDADTPPQTYGIAVPYAREYIQFRLDYDRLESIAQAGGGRVMPVGSGREVFASTEAGRAYRDTLWMWLLVAAVVLLLFELLWKKLIMPIGSITTSRLRIVTDEGEVRPATEAAEGSTHPSIPSYADFRAQVAHAYSAERKKPEPVLTWHHGGEHNPVAERKIYIARKRRQ
jgi:uncharacterized membrane protein